MKHWILSALLYSGLTIANPHVVHHELLLEFNKEGTAFIAEDFITIDDSVITTIHLDPAYQLTRVDTGGGNDEVVSRAPDGSFNIGQTKTLRVHYRGETGGADGWPYLVFTPAGSWYPDTGHERVTFGLEVRAANGWELLSQGRRFEPETDSATVRWDQANPQQGIYLVAGPYSKFEQSLGSYTARALLLSDDAALAGPYLEAALDYMSKYSNALGDYPYTTFSLVENQRQTGYGMPAFTLLGSRVIRLPFILHSSYPHEILHNWWGNGVFVDYSNGNWGESLTTYLSDHLSRESQGRGISYRRDTLISYQDFVSHGEDFPLSRFRGRQDKATQAVGYGKGMMVFHMLRTRLGDRVFLDALRKFYQTWRYRYASFSDLQKAFEKTCECELGIFFRQWLDNTGAPTVHLVDVDVWSEADRHYVSIELSQQGADIYDLRVPVRILDTGGTATDHLFELSGPRQRYVLSTDRESALVQVDPDFDLFRKLHPDERPSTLGGLFGADSVSIAISTTTNRFINLAKQWAGSNEGWQVEALNRSIVEGSSRFFLGWNNPEARAIFSKQENSELAFGRGWVEINGEVYPVEDHVIALTLDRVNEEGDRLTAVWLVADDPRLVAAVLPRLIHYNRYSYVVFSEGERRAITKGQWRTDAKLLTGRLTHVKTGIKSAIVRTPLF